LKKAISTILCVCLFISIFPATFATAIQQRASYLFAIDAGHGGNDPGCTGADGRYECNDNYKIAQEVILLLNQQGQRTHLINRNLTTANRPVEANNVGADFLISLHRDSSSSKSASGINIYTHEPSHTQRTMQPTKDYAPNESPDKHAVDTTLVNNMYSYLSGAGLLTVASPHYGSASAPTWEDYYINRISNMPSCIIEYGFATNPNDNAVFDAYYKSLALATVKALLATVGLEYVGPFTNSSVGTIQSCNNQQYYVINGAVTWNYSGEIEYNNIIYIIENGGVKYNYSLPTGGIAESTGQCKWIWHEDELKIIGAGATADYSDTNQHPWSSEITYLTVGNGVTTLGENTFSDCSSLSLVTLSKSVTNIKDGAFKGCDNLKAIKYYGTKEDFEKITIGKDNDILSTASKLYICDIEGHKYNFSCSSSCSVCGEKRETTHTYSNACDESCNVCGEKRITTHTYCSECDTICDICGCTRSSSTSHSYNISGLCIHCGEIRTVPGDVNNDGVIDVIDAAKIRKHILLIEILNVNTNPAADVNHDGVIDVIDAAKVRKHILKIELLQN